MQAIEQPLAGCIFLATLWWPFALPQKSFDNKSGVIAAPGAEDKQAIVTGASSQGVSGVHLC